MIIKEKAYARAGLIGNPSDGYFGKTISIRLKNYFAEVTLYESPELEIIPNRRDHCRFKNLDELVDDITFYDYYGGIRLLKASLKKFADYCKENRIKLKNKNFTIRYYSNIPHSVGMAGSSAIITAAFNALMRFYKINIPKEKLPNLILSTESDELKIAAGLQDRVIQVYGGIVYMDFNKRHMLKYGYGIYENLPLKNLPPLYIAYRKDLAEISDKVHSNIKARFDNGDKNVINAMKFFAQKTAQLKSILLGKKKGNVGKLLDSNFDKRKEITKISQKNLEMVETARKEGCSAKFTGSGGAIIGTYPDDKVFKSLQNKFRKMRIEIFKPEII